MLLVCADDFLAMSMYGSYIMQSTSSIRGAGMLKAEMTLCLW